MQDTFLFDSNACKLPENAVFFGSPLSEEKRFLFEFVYPE